MREECTAWPDSLAGVSYGHCCAAHDAAYRAGAPKIPADLELAQCVIAAGGPAWWALLMLAGVLIAGRPFYLHARRKYRRGSRFYRP